MNIAYIQTMKTSCSGSGGSVHVSQVAANLLQRGHKLYTNLPFESAQFTYFSLEDFMTRAGELDLYYIRIHGAPFNDSLTLLRQANYEVPCIWEINSPLEELRLRGVSDNCLEKKNGQRKSLARLVDGAICVSEEMARYAKHDLGIQNCIVIPNGSDPDLFSPAKRSPALYKPDKFVVFWAGSPKYPWQGLRIVQEVAAKMKTEDPDVIFAVTAEGESHGNMFYLGKIPYDEMPMYMASAHVGLCIYETYIYETINFYNRFYGSPLKLYDYMASGLPVIGSSLGQIKRVVEQIGNGLLTDNSVDGIIENILFLKTNQQETAEMGRKGRQAVEEIYSWQNIVKKSEKFMKDTCAAYRKTKSPVSPLSKIGRVLWKLRYQYTFNFKKPIINRFVN